LASASKEKMRKQFQRKDGCGRSGERSEERTASQIQDQERDDGEGDYVGGDAVVHAKSEGSQKKNRFLQIPSQRKRTILKRKVLLKSVQPLEGMIGRQPWPTSRDSEEQWDPN